MPMTNAQRQARFQQRRMRRLKEARECIADIEAILNSVDLTVWDAAHQARLRIVEYSKSRLIAVGAKEKKMSPKTCTITCLILAAFAFGGAFGANQPVLALAGFVFLIAAILFAKDA